MTKCKACWEQVLPDSEYCAEHHALLRPSDAQRAEWRKAGRKAERQNFIFQFAIWGFLALLAVFGIYMNSLQPEQPEPKRYFNPDTYVEPEACLGGFYVGC